VIVILAILAAIAIPALTGYITKAQDEGLKAEGRTVEMAAQTIGSDRHNVSLSAAATQATVGQLSGAVGKTLTKADGSAETAATTATLTHWVQAVNALASTSYPINTGMPTVKIQYGPGNKVLGMLFTKGVATSDTTKWAYYNGAAWSIETDKLADLATGTSGGLELSTSTTATPVYFTPTQPMP
jgi:type II secretory pathway pseudopilin PulG